MNSEVYNEILELLKRLITTPSFSREEGRTAACIVNFLEDKSVEINKKFNNIWARNIYFNTSLPTILLNSHHDTVKPVNGYSRDPFSAVIEDGKLFGLGSSDAGGALVSLIATFLHFYSRQDLPWNLVLAATAEEEISGSQGVEALLDELGEIDLAIVGEPTDMKMAIAEKGLMVLDGKYFGVSGHAARNEGENAIYKAIQDVEWFKSYKFEKDSALLGPVNMNVTQIDGGTNHNVTPDLCHLVVDVRSNECYTPEEILETINDQTKGNYIARSARLRPSRIDTDHTVVQAGSRIGLQTFGSATSSDQALMPFPSIKMGPGSSSRSHTANEFIYLREIEEGMAIYVELLEEIKTLEKTKTPQHETMG